MEQASVMILNLGDEEEGTYVESTPEDAVLGGALDDEEVEEIIFTGRNQSKAELRKMKSLKIKPEIRTTGRGPCQPLTMSSM